MEPENVLAWEQSSLPQPPDLLDDIEICADKKKDIYLLHYLLKSFSLRFYVPTVGIRRSYAVLRSLPPEFYHQAA